jgi:hypothetical protein
MIDLTTSDHSVTTIVGGCSRLCTTDLTGTHAGNVWAFTSPHSPFIDGNYLYFTDSSSHILLRTDLLSVSYDTKVFYGTWGSGNVNGLSGPGYLYVTTQGTSKSIYVTEEAAGLILKLNLDSTATSVSSVEKVMGVYGQGGITANTSDSRGKKVSAPRGVWVDESSNLLYYAERGMSAVRTIDMANGYALKTVVASLNTPSGVFGKGSKIYFTEQGRNLVHLITLHPSSTSKGVHTHLRRI